MYNPSPCGQIYITYIGGSSYPLYIICIYWLVVPVFAQISLIIFYYALTFCKKKIDHLMPMMVKVINVETCKKIPPFNVIDSESYKC